MPRGDKTGPQGVGPMTGRRMGNCVEEGERGFGFGRGFFGRGTRSGGGFGRGFGFFERNVNPGNEQVINEEISSMKSRLSFLENLLRKSKSED